MMGLSVVQRAADGADIGFAQIVGLDAGGGNDAGGIGRRVGERLGGGKDAGAERERRAAVEGGAAGTSGGGQDGSGSMAILGRVGLGVEPKLTDGGLRENVGSA